MPKQKKIIVEEPAEEIAIPSKPQFDISGAISGAASLAAGPPGLAASLVPKIIDKAPEIIRESRGVLQDIGKGARNLFGIQDVDEVMRLEAERKKRLDDYNQEIAKMNISAKEKEQLRAYYKQQEDLRWQREKEMMLLQQQQQENANKARLNNIKDLYSFMAQQDKDIFNTKDLRYKMLKDAVFKDIANYVDTNAMLQDYKSNLRNYRNNRVLKPEIYEDEDEDYSAYKKQQQRKKGYYAPLIDKPYGGDEGSMEGYGM